MVELLRQLQLLNVLDFRPQIWTRNLLHGIFVLPNKIQVRLFPKKTVELNNSTRIVLQRLLHSVGGKDGNQIEVIRNHVLLALVVLRFPFQIRLSTLNWKGNRLQRTLCCSRLWSSKRSIRELQILKWD